MVADTSYGSDDNVQDASKDKIRYLESSVEREMQHYFAYREALIVDGSE